MVNLPSMLSKLSLDGAQLSQMKFIIEFHRLEFVARQQTPPTHTWEVICLMGNIVGLHADTKIALLRRNYFS